MLMTVLEQVDGGKIVTRVELPRPPEGWKWPTLAELEASIKEDELSNPLTLEADGFCGHSSLGLYMVCPLFQRQATND